MKKSSIKKGKGVLIAVVVAVIVIVALLFLFVPKNSTEEPAQEVETPGTKEPTPTEITEHIVERTLQGFVPKILEINVGDTVTWVNKLSFDVRPSGDFHPTHTIYPGSSIVKCGTPEENTIFDACQGLGFEETYSFVFNEVGEWDYHDHLKPSKGGTIIVS